MRAWFQGAGQKLQAALPAASYVSQDVSQRPGWSQAPAPGRGRGARESRACKTTRRGWILSEPRSNSSTLWIFPIVSHLLTRLSGYIIGWPTTYSLHSGDSGAPARHRSATVVTHRLRKLCAPRPCCLPLRSVPAGLMPEVAGTSNRLFKAIRAPGGLGSIEHQCVLIKTRPQWYASIIACNPRTVANNLQNWVVFVYSVLPCQVMLAHPHFDSRERMGQSL